MENFQSSIQAALHHPAIQTALDASGKKLTAALPEILLSFLLIFLVLVLLAAVYRGASGDEEIEKPVTLNLLANCKDNEIILAPKHLQETTVHNGKAPWVIFYLQYRDNEEKVLAKSPLKIIVRVKNSKNVYDKEYNETIDDFGQVGIGHAIHTAIERKLEEIYRRTGRRFDADTAKFRIKFKYPSQVNIDYLLREHPDASVRVGAWIFILTSIFSTAQSALFK
jgi:hypothetical protein